MSNATGSVVKQLSHVLLDGTLSIENRLVKLITMAVVAVLAVVVVRCRYCCCSTSSRQGRATNSS